MLLRSRQACAQHAEREKLAIAFEGPRILKAVPDAHGLSRSKRSVQVAGDQEVDHGLVRDPEPTSLQDARELGLVPLDHAVVARCAAGFVEETLEGQRECRERGHDPD